MNAYLNAMRRYVDFGGRSSRSEFWLYVLVYVIIYIIAIVLDALVLGHNMSQGGVGIFTGIVALVHLLPGLAVAVRRLHDTDRSGWWILICLIPLIGAIWLIVLYCSAGTLGANRFGPPQS
jgi:uncharacterized membrane protein YhaH (DUF805 family)